MKNKMKINEKIICYYHNDMDGIASASIVKKVYPNAKFVSVDYSDGIKDTSYIFKKYDKVIIVDFSFNKDIFTDLVNSYNNTPLLYQNQERDLIWIDHHNTAAKNLPELWEGGIRGIRKLGISACELTWMWFFPNKNIPIAIELIGDRDLWQFKFGDKTRAFHEAVSIKYKIPDTNIPNMKEQEIKELINLGKILFKNKRKQVRKSFEQGVDILFEKHKTRVINTNINVSDTGEYCYKYMKYPIAFIWSVRNGKVICSLRSDTVDVGKIAEKYGGGGHKFAAAFVDNEGIIREIYNKINMTPGEKFIKLIKESNFKW